jgi:hypothetical protein
MVKFLFSLIACVAIAFGAYWAWQNQDEIASLVQDGQKNGSIITFELDKTPDSIAQRYQKELLKTPEHTFGKTEIKFVPYLLMDVKYTREDKKTDEAKILWSLENGEMVLDTSSFDSTHGFEDCINSQASEDDFRILHALSRKGGTTTKEILSEELGMDPDMLLDRLDGLRKKHLIAIKQDTIRLHFQSPLLKVQPQTKIAHNLVTKEVSCEDQIKPKYSKEQVRKVAKAAFGQDFAIRSQEIVFVPIFVIEVKNPDGSTFRTYWNGVTGKRVDMRHFFY